MSKFMKFFNNKYLKSRIEILKLVEISILTTKKLISQLKNLFKPKNDSLIELESLTPTINGDKNYIYCSAIKSAIDNEDNHNIAIAGGYGSGKSSILKSFQKKYKYEYKFLNISLATFNIEDSINEEDSLVGQDQSDNPSTKPTVLQTLQNKFDVEVDQKIELSILQQLLYHVKANKLPNSRFKRIKKFNWKMSVLYSFLLFIWLLSLISIINPFFSKNLSFCTEIILLGKSIHIGHLKIFSIFSFGIVCFLYLAIKFVSNTKLSKLNLKDGEIEVECPNERSILNRYLDEIMYFFEVNKYNVVIIEDLDRLKNAMIFTKLRELNNMLNNSKQIKIQIVFIYALKDDLFTDKNRTKFFDVIIPVIPIINNSNSGDMFLKLLKEKKLNQTLSPELIGDISLYIDDMRLLKNIYNEYVIYMNMFTEELKKNLSYDKLLAMIVYKNIFPTDFMALHEGKGTIKSLINQKDLFIKNAITEIDIKIDSLKNTLDEIEETILLDEIELRALYIHALWSLMPGDVMNVFIENNQTAFSELTTNDNFNRLIKSGIKRYKRNNGGVSEINIPFSQIEGKVNGDRKYSSRLDTLKLKAENGQEKIKKEIEVLSKKRLSLKSWTLSQLLNNNPNLFPEFKSTKSQLTKYLLRSGYINEDYNYYISYFHVGSITQDERNFIFSVRNQDAFDYSYKLINIKNIIAKLHIDEFEQSAILNINLMDFLIENDDIYQIQLNLIYEQLTNETNRSIEFIDIYSNSGLKIDLFINSLARKWTNMWNFIQLNSKYTIERMNFYLDLIIKNADISDIKKLDIDRNLSNHLSIKKDFLDFISEDENEKAKKIIKELSIKFKLFQLPITNLALFNFIYENSYYLFSFEMIEIILQVETGKQSDELLHSLNNKNYSTIINSNCNYLNQYINNNIDEYVADIYLKIEGNRDEDEECIIELLNNEGINIKNKEQIIFRTNTIINNLLEIESKDLWQMLAAESKFAPTWSNIILYYGHFKLIDEPLIEFFNNDINSEALSYTKIISLSSLDDEMKVKLSSDIILCEELNIDSYKKLVACVSEKYSSLPCEKLSKEKIKYIIEVELLMLSASNYDYLSLNFTDMHIFLIAKNKQEFIETLTDYIINEDDLYKIFNLDSFNIDQKLHVLAHIDKTKSFLIIENKLANVICANLIFTNPVLLSIDFFCSIIQNATENERHKVRAADRYIRICDKSKLKIEKILVSLGKPYSEITEIRRKPIKINSGKTYEEFGKLLEEIKYISSVKVHDNFINIFTKRK